MAFDAIFNIKKFGIFSSLLVSEYAESNVFA